MVFAIKLAVKIQYDSTGFTQKFITSSLACQILFEALLKFLKVVMAVILQFISDVMGQCSNVYQDMSIKMLFIVF